MKKFISIIILVFIVNISIPVTSYATGESTEVNIIIKDDFKSGSNVDIVFEVENIYNLYGVQLEFNYNNSDIEINTISRGNFVDTNETSIYEAFKEIDNKKKSLRYGFTYTGDYKGISGSGDVVVLNVKVGNGEKLNINKDTIILKLVQNSNSGIKLSEYKLNEINFIGSQGDEKPSENKPESNKDISDSNLNNNNTLGSVLDTKDEVDLADKKESEKDLLDDMSVDKEIAIQENEEDLKDNVLKKDREDNISVLIGVGISIVIIIFIFIFYKNKKTKNV